MVASTSDRSRRTGDAWWKQGHHKFQFLSLRDREPLLALPPATPEPDKDVAVGEAPDGVSPATVPKETKEPALAPEVLVGAGGSRAEATIRSW